MGQIFRFDSLQGKIPPWSFSQNPVILLVAGKLFSKLFPNAKLSVKFRFFDAILNYFRVVAMHIITQNELKPLLTSFKSVDDFKDYNPDMVQSFIDTMQQLSMFKKKRKCWELKPIYFANINCDNLFEIINFNPERLKDFIGEPMLRDFIFIHSLIIIFHKKSVNPILLRVAKINVQIVNLVNSGDFDYEIRFCETIFEIRNTNLKTKLKTSFTDDYFTESGRKAFNQFTSLNFSELIKFLIKNHDVASVLDIGCGFGNYIDLLSKFDSLKMVTGLEIQENVFVELEKKYAEYSNVRVVNCDIFKYKTTEKFDVILLNYVIMYFEKKQKKQLFEKLHSLLNNGGKFIICHYFPDNLNVREYLCKSEGKLNLSAILELYFSSKVSYINTFINDTFEPFQTGERWKSLLERIEECGFEIEYLMAADRYYYSLFMVVKSQ